MFEFSVASCLKQKGSYCIGLIYFKFEMLSLNSMQSFFKVLVILAKALLSSPLKRSCIQNFSHALLLFLNFLMREINLLFQSQNHFLIFQKSQKYLKETPKPHNSFFIFCQFLCTVACNKTRRFNINNYEIGCGLFIF